jgi:phage terminase small subunit
MAKKKIEDKITPFQQQFVDIWFNMNFNGKLAYKQLKPNVSNETATVEASKLLTIPNVVDYIELKQEHIRIKQEVSLEFIVNGLKSIIMDVAEEQVERDDQGRITSKPDRKSALAAYQQLTKIAGFDAPKKIDVKLSGNIDISKLVSFDDDDDEKQQLND